MTDNLGILLRIELRKRLRLKSAKMIGVAVAFAVAIVVMMGYCFGMAYGFGYLGMAEVIPGYALTITAIAILVFTFFKTNGILFAARDYDLLMALPVRTGTVITVKFLSMYLNNLLFAVAVMMPMGVGYFLWTPIQAGALSMWLIGMIVSPLLPMTIAAVIGTGIIAIGAGSKHKVLVQMVLSIALLGGIFGISYLAQRDAMADEAMFLSKLADLGAMISQLLHKVYPLSAWFDAAVTGHQYSCGGVLVGVSLAIYGVFVWICGKNYRWINSALQSHHTSTNYKLKTLKSSSMRAALVYKEWKRFTSSSVYMMNIGMGLILALLASIASIFVGIDKLIESMGIASPDVIQPILTMVMPFGIAMLVNMCNTGCVSLSLEGRNLWVVESLPVSRRTLLQGKMLFNMLLVLPVSLICNAIFILELHVPAGLALLYLLFAAASVAVSTVFGIFVNLHFPNYQWENEVEVIKQSAASMLGIFGGLLGFLLMGAAAVFLHTVISGELILLGATLLCVILAVVFYRACK